MRASAASKHFPSSPRLPLLLPTVFLSSPRLPLLLPSGPLLLPSVCPSFPLLLPSVFPSCFQVVCFPRQFAEGPQALCRARGGVESDARGECQVEETEQAELLVWQQLVEAEAEQAELLLQLRLVEAEPGQAELLLRLQLVEAGPGQVELLLLLLPRLQLQLVEAGEQVELQLVEAGAQVERQTEGPTHERSHLLPQLLPQFPSLRALAQAPSCTSPGDARSLLGLSSPLRLVLFDRLQKWRRRMACRRAQLGPRRGDF